MDLKALQWELAAAVANQGLDSLHNPKNLAMALAAEAGTLLHLFKWPTAEESRQTDRAEAREATTDALVEVFLHALRMADELGIDLEQAIARKLGKSASAPAPASPPPAEPALASAPRAEPPRASEPPAGVAARRAERPASVPEPRRAAEPAKPAVASPRPAESPRTKREAPVVSPSARGPASRLPRAARATPPPRMEEPPPPRMEEPPPPRMEESLPPRIEQAPPEEPDRYEDLDLDKVGEILKALAQRVDNAASDAPLLRELQDELGTLRRTLYGKTLKRSWIGASLKNVRTMLKEAADQGHGGDIRAKENIEQIDGLLKD
ncbi:MAG TPA: hypothetical protein VKC64_02815 [Burkholderiales bacterium]|nr:hypothetical protein [Burkholderiales bacterium]